MSTKAGFWADGAAEADRTDPIDRKDQMPGVRRNPVGGSGVEKTPGEAERIESVSCWIEITTVYHQDTLQENPPMGTILYRTLSSLVVGGALLASSCGPTSPYRPFFDEGGSGASIDEFTYVSTSLAPKTISIIDTRTNETVFSIDIPVGQQLSINFDELDKNKGKYMSGTMRWALMRAGDRYGRLTNRVDVPPPDARRIDMTLRQSPEVASPPTAMGG